MFGSGGKCLADPCIGHSVSSLPPKLPVVFVSDGVE
jgi:hypothetical protein